MITTRGFRDILHMARHKRPHNFSLQFDVPWQSKPLVKRRNRHRGHRAHHAARRRDRGAARRGRGASAPRELFAKRGLDAVIVAFLFSFLNNEHEQRAKEIVPRSPAGRLRQLLVRCRQLDPRIRALLQRRDERLYRPEDVAPTCRSLEERLRRQRHPRHGARHAVQRRHLDHRECESSDRSACCCRGRPAASSAAAGPASTAARSNIITIDIGGTSADIA